MIREDNMIMVIVHYDSYLADTTMAFTFTSN